MAIGKFNIGEVLADLGRYAESLESVRTSAKSFAQLLERRPGGIEDLKKLAMVRSFEAGLSSKLGHPERARQAYDAALSIWRRLAEDHHTVAKYRTQMAEVHNSIGLILSQMGKPEAAAEYAEAVKDWDKAIELSTPAEQPNLRAGRVTSRLYAGQHAEAIAEAAELTKSPIWDAGQWYNFAIAYAVVSSKVFDNKQEYADRALELLQQAVKAGYKDAAHMKKDTDLDPLRDRDEFKKLLAELEKK